MTDERRKEYTELTDIKVQLGIVITELKNVTKALESHQAEDLKVADRVNALEKYIATLNGKIAAYSTAGAGASVFIGAILKSKGVL